MVEKCKNQENSTFVNATSIPQDYTHSFSGVTKPEEGNNTSHNVQYKSGIRSHHTKT